MSWIAVEETVPRAHSIAFDGCHKIYVLLDDEQTRQMIEYGYRSDGSTMLLRSEGATSEQMLEALREWFDESCGLRFINAVRTVPGDPNDGFTSLIAQFELDENEDDEYEEEWDDEYV